MKLQSVMVFLEKWKWGIEDSYGIFPEFFWQRDGLTAGPGCSPIHSSHRGRSAGRTPRRGWWATCADPAQKHLLSVQALWVRETETWWWSLYVTDCSLRHSYLFRMWNLPSSRHHFFSLILNPSGGSKKLHHCWNNSPTQSSVSLCFLTALKPFFFDHQSKEESWRGELTVTK